MKKIEPLTDEEGEVRELPDEDFARLKRFHELPTDMQAKLRRGRGPQKAPTKELISLFVPAIWPLEPRNLEEIPAENLVQRLGYGGNAHCDLTSALGAKLVPSWLERERSASLITGQGIPPTAPASGSAGRCRRCRPRW